MEDTDGGLHPAVDGQSLDEDDEDEDEYTVSVNTQTQRMLPTYNYSSGRGTVGFGKRILQSGSWAGVRKKELLNHRSRS